MAARRSDEQRIKDMARYINETESRLDLIFSSSDDFLNRNDWFMTVLSDGVEHTFNKVLEEANNISERTKEEYQDIPWHQIRGMRNIVTHGYNNLDRQTLLDSMVNDFPQLSDFCERYAEEHGFEVIPRYIPTGSLKQARNPESARISSRQTSFADKLDMLNRATSTIDRRNPSRRDLSDGPRRTR